MNTENQLRELYRKRWLRHRTRARLVNSEDENFATGGLAQYLRDCSVRLMVLPRDPDAVLVANFDAPFWEWWVRTWQNPFPDAQPTSWGETRIPTVDAAVRFDYYNDRWEWIRFLALHRHGGLEFGLGRETAWPVKNPETGESHRRFSLIAIVGRTWSALAIYGQVLQHLQENNGPWEVTLGLRDTTNAVLGNVGAGWMEADEQLYELQPILCSEPNVLIRREVGNWPEGDDLRELAFTIGGNIEDAWGMPERRFLAHKGEHAGNFDASRYS